MRLRERGRERELREKKDEMERNRGKKREQGR